MRKALVLVMILALLVSTPAAFAAKSNASQKNTEDAWAAEPNIVSDVYGIEPFTGKSNEGTVTVLDDVIAGWDSASDIYETEPFIPEDMISEGSDNSDEIIEDAIFGNDGRVKVIKPYKYPFSTIANMVVTAKCGDSWCGTGFMVSRDRLLTAAHVLVCPRHNAWATHIDFYFGYQNKNKYLYHYRGKWKARVGNVFKEHQYTIENDYGCVKLYQNVGDVVGWLGAHWNMPSPSVESTYMYVAGYRGGKLTYGSGWVTAMDNTHLAYTIDTVSGNSGGPIFTRKYYATGFNIAHNTSNNIGYRLTGNIRGYLYGLD